MLPVASSQRSGPHVTCLVPLQRLRLTSQLLTLLAKAPVAAAPPVRSRARAIALACEGRQPRNGEGVPGGGAEGGRLHGHGPAARVAHRGAEAARRPHRVAQSEPHAGTAQRCGAARNGGASGASGVSGASGRCVLPCGRRSGIGGRGAGRGVALRGRLECNIEGHCDGAHREVMETSRRGDVAELRAVLAVLHGRQQWQRETSQASRAAPR